MLSVYIKPIERIAVMSHRNIEVQEKKRQRVRNRPLPLVDVSRYLKGSRTDFDHGHNNNSHFNLSFSRFRWTKLVTFSTT